MSDAFALTGSASPLHHPQGCCPGLCAFALAGRGVEHRDAETRRYGDTEARRHGGAETRRCGDTEENIMFSKIRRVF